MNLEWVLRRGDPVDRLARGNLAKNWGALNDTGAAAIDKAE
jgi:hypothetical protein